jgi:long-chain fatty acid transport protein
VVPNLYLTVPVDKRWSVCVGVNAPFGLVTEYQDGWIGRFQGLKSDIKTINVNPAVSWKATEQVAIGFGANYQHIDANFTSNVNYSAALLSAAAQSGLFTPAHLGQLAQATSGLQSDANVSGSDYAWGWNVGVLWDIDQSHRVGVHYRSAIKYTVTGNVKFDNPSQPAGLPPEVGLVAGAVNSQLSNSVVSSQIKLPEIVNLSYVGKLNGHWEVMADVQYTGWSSVKQLTFTRSNGSPLQSTRESFDDTWRVAIGANYHHNDQWLFRAGLAYDQSPVQDAYRTVRLPDADRMWLALGAQYRFNPSLWLDVGAAYLWVRSASINDVGSTNLGVAPSAAQNGMVNGSYDSSTVILAAQLTYAF